MRNLFLSVAAAVGFISLSIVPAHGALTYAVGQTYGKTERLPQISALAAGKDDFLAVASMDKIFIYDPAKGESVRNFDTGMKGITAVAVDGQTIYVFSRRTEAKEIQANGRKYTLEVPLEALCKTFTWEGSPIGDIKLEKLTDVINAKVLDGKIYVSDFGGTHTVRSFDAKTGKSLKSYGKDLRLCCGILDFAVDPKTSDVLIANLGAFRLERYSSGGYLRSSFGKRGQQPTGFQGCCNPVSAAVLPDGNLVVAEKDPSRVKVYSSNGQMLFAFSDLQELVKGCNRVSVAVDSKGRVYLGANTSEHFVLQYVPKT